MNLKRYQEQVLEGPFCKYYIDMTQERGEVSFSRTVLDHIPAIQQNSHSHSTASRPSLIPRPLLTSVP